MKFLFVAFFTCIGLYIGKRVIHDKLFRELLKLRMFFKDKGSWLCMFWAAIFSLRIGWFS